MKLKCGCKNKIYSLVFSFFEKDKNKTEEWFTSKNPMLGNISPETMLLIGREKKLYEFVKNQLEQGD